MSNRDGALATILGFAALPILVCLLRAFGPRWFNAWVALAIDVAIGAWLYAGAAWYHSENNLNYLRARSENPALEYPATELCHLFYAALAGLGFALVYYAPFALVYYAWESWKRDKVAARVEIEENR